MRAMSRRLILSREYIHVRWCYIISLHLYVQHHNCNCDQHSGYRVMGRLSVGWAPGDLLRVCRIVMQIARLTPGLSGQRTAQVRQSPMAGERGKPAQKAF